jgi:hypothetical protein
MLHCEFPSVCLRGIDRRAVAAQSIDDSRWEAYAAVSICLARQHKVHEAVKFQNLALDRAPVEERDKVFDVLTRVASGGPQQK